MEESTTLSPGSPVRQFSILLQNRAGALASLVKLLRNNAIEVVGISVQDSRDATVARLVVTDPDSAEQIFMEKGIPFTTCDLLVLALKEAGPELLPVLDTLMVAETNIDFAYGLMPSQNGRALLAMHVEDYDFAVSVMNQAGFSLKYQEDLSR